MWVCVPNSEAQQKVKVLFRVSHAAFRKMIIFHSYPWIVSCLAQAGNDIHYLEQRVFRRYTFANRRKVKKRKKTLHKGGRQKRNFFFLEI